MNKMTKTRGYWWKSVVALATVLCVIFLASHFWKAHKHDTPTHAIAASNLDNQSSAVDDRSEFVSHLRRLGVSESEDANHSEPIQGDSSNTSALSQLLARHQPLAKKAVLLGEEKLELNQLLSEPANIDLARDRLLEAAPNSLSQKEQDERIATVRFLTDALRYKNNPASDKVVSACRDIILSGNHRGSESLQVKKSMAGDKVKLYLAMSNFAPDAAKKLLADGEQSSNNKLLDYAKRVAQNEPADP